MLSYRLFRYTGLPDGSWTVVVMISLKHCSWTLEVFIKLLNAFSASRILCGDWNCV